MLSVQVSVRVIGCKQGHGLSMLHDLQLEFTEIQKLIKRESAVSQIVCCFKIAGRVDFSPSCVFFHRAENVFRREVKFPWITQLFHHIFI